MKQPLFIKPLWDVSVPDKNARTLSPQERQSICDRIAREMADEADEKIFSWLMMEFEARKEDARRGGYFVPEEEKNYADT
jgi:hypothetical protein